MNTTPTTTMANPAPVQSAATPPDLTAGGRDPVGQWLAKQGVLFLLLQTPVIGVLVSYVYGLDQLDSAVFPVFVAFSALTGWVAYRKARSTDPAEPVHRLHLYALYAMLPVAAFSLVQIPFIGVDPAYWATWLELGTQFTNSGADPWSFLAGVVWSALVGIGLVLGYYVLFRRHDLVNAGLYFGVVFLAAAMYVLPLFSPATTHVGPRWYLTQAIACAALAATAWAMPAFWNWVARPAAGRPRRPNRPRAVALAGAVLVLLAPYAVAAERTANRQLNEQEARDLAAFDQLMLEPTGVAVLRGVQAQTASYELTLRLGPRIYTTAAGPERAVDARPVVVEGWLASGDTVAAWCTGHAAQLESPTAQTPDGFATAARRLDYVDVALLCAGPAGAIDELLCPAGRTLTASWRAEATLIGERTTQRLELSGQTSTIVEPPTGMTC
jgi:hypothetical protein